MMKTDRHTLITQTGLAESVGLSYRLSDADFDGTRSSHAKTAKKWRGSRLALPDGATQGEQQRPLQSTLRYYTFSVYLAVSGPGLRSGGLWVKPRCGQI